MENQKKELFRIGEVAKLFHLGIGTLRHYDKMGLLKPEYIDEDTGYRYYSIRQFECLNTIRYLRVLDMPLEEIRDFLNNRDTDKIQEMLERQKEGVKRRQEELRRIERKIDNRLTQLKDALASEFDRMMFVQMPARRLAFLKTEVRPETYLDLEHSIRSLEKAEPVVFLGKVGVGISKDRLEKGIFDTYDMVFVKLEEEDRFEGESLYLPSGLCGLVRFQGTHRQAKSYYEGLMEFIRKKGYEAAGFSEEVTIIDEGLTRDRGRFVTEIGIPVKKRPDQK